MSTTGYANQEFVDDVHERVQGEKQAEREAAREADQTRRSLESRPAGEPAEPDDVLETEPADGDSDEDGGGPSLEDLAEPYEMREDRYVGYESMTVDGEEYQIGNPNIHASNEMTERLEKLEQSRAPQRILLQYAVETLAEWTTDDSYDTEYWSRNLSGLEAITLHNSLAMGGNTRLM